MDFHAKEMAYDLLMTEKHLSQFYLVTALNSANEKLRNTLIHYQGNGLGQYVEWLNEMEQRGWSQSAVAGQQAIESTINVWEQQQIRHPELGQE